MQKLFFIATFNLNPIKMMRNKELTKKKLIEAVGEIFREEGYEGIGVNKIAKRAGVDKKLIYRYFNNVDQLLEAYIVEKDHWKVFSAKINEVIAEESSGNNTELLIQLFQNRWKFFSTEKEMQNLMQWELSGESELMKSIYNVREMFAQNIFKLTDPDFENSDVNFRAISALLVGGIYYTVLHTMHNGNIVCGVDVRSEEGNEAILKAIRQIVQWAFDAAQKSKQERSSSVRY